MLSNWASQFQAECSQFAALINNIEEHKQAVMNQKAFGSTFGQGIIYGSVLWGPLGREHKHPKMKDGRYDTKYLRYHFTCHFYFLHCILIILLVST
jgi:hypothetical protein